MACARPVCNMHGAASTLFITGICSAQDGCGSGDIGAACHGLVPGAGFEPARPDRPGDFKSPVSACFTTRAECKGWGRNRTGLDGFAIRCIATLPPSRVDGAGNEVRTRDLNLGKVALYQLSYSRLGGQCSESGGALSRRCTVQPRTWWGPRPSNVRHQRLAGISGQHCGCFMCPAPPPHPSGASTGH